jgi:hypothetical protein
MKSKNPFFLALQHERHALAVQCEMCTVKSRGQSGKMFSKHLEEIFLAILLELKGKKFVLIPCLVPEIFV